MISLDINSLLTILLMYFRVVSFVFLVPFFGTFFVPNFVRLYLAFALTVSIFFFSEIEPLEITSAAEFIYLAIREFLFGFIAGFFLRLLFEAIMIAGEIMAVNAGLGFAMIFLPQQPQVTVLAGFTTLLGSTLFLSLGGAEAVYIGLAKSFESYPLGNFDLYSLNGEVFLDFFYQSFNLGVKLALPVIIVALITNIVLAVINRFIPQINVFMVGLPLQIFVGLVVMMISMPVIGLVIVNHIRKYIMDFVAFMGA